MSSFIGVPVHAGTLMYPGIVKKNRVSPWLVKELFPDHSGFFFPTKTLQKNAPLTVHSCKAGRRKSKINIIGHIHPVVKSYRP